MSIEPFTTSHPRRYVAFHGTPPNDQGVEVFTALGYEVRTLVEADLANPNQLALIDSAIIFQDRARPSRVHEFLKIASPALMGQGCRIYVAPADASGAQTAHFRQIVVNAVAELELPVVGIDLKNRAHEGGDSAEQVYQPCIHILASAADWSYLARLVTCNPADASADPAIEIEALDNHGNKINLDPETNDLVRRAFFDCARVRMVPEVDGMSDVAVYRAYVVLRSGDVGPFPYLYFVKVGKRSKVEKEYQQYRSTAMEYIPFHLGPRVRQNRCALGYSKGIIVGDYVSGAEKLRDSAKDGRAVHVIGNLFNHTLGAWRVNAQRSQITLIDAVADRWPSQMPEWREPKVRELGGTTSLARLRAMFERLPQGEVLVGVIHGDLHATNVLARMSDGIVIDFEKVEIGKPLLLDPASLESGLFIDGFIGDQRPADEVLTSLMPLYRSACFRQNRDVGFGQDGEICHPSDKSAWFFDCARHIRMHAREMELTEFQYAAALALCFIKKSCNPRDFGKEPNAGLSRETVRAMAFVFGERILRALTAPPSAPA